MDQEPLPDDGALESEFNASADESIRRHLAPFVEEARRKALSDVGPESPPDDAALESEFNASADESIRRHLAPFVEEARRAALGTPPLKASVDYPYPAFPRVIFNQPLFVREAAHYLWPNAMRPEFMADLLPIPDSASPDGRHKGFWFKPNSENTAWLRRDVERAVWAVGPPATPLSTQLRDPRIPPQVWSKMEWIEESGGFASDKLPRSVNFWGAGRRGEDLLIHARQVPGGAIELTPYAFWPEDPEYYNGVFPNDSSLARRMTEAAIEINAYTRYEMSKDPYLPPDEAKNQAVLKLKKLYFEVLGEAAEAFARGVVPEAAGEAAKYLLNLLSEALNYYKQKVLKKSEEEDRKTREESEKIYIAPTR